MKKTSLYLEDELHAAVGRLADREGMSRAETIRQALRAATKDVSRPRITAIGIGEGPGDVAENMDRYLAEWGFGED